jgi:hypothetical protein
MWGNVENLFAKKRAAYSIVTTREIRCPVVKFPDLSPPKRGNGEFIGIEIRE